MIRKLLPVLLVLALSTIACGFHVSVPINTITPGPMVTDQINVPLPDTTQTVDLSLAFGAGTLKIQPGATALVSGTAKYNIADFKPVVTSNGSTVRIEQGNWHLKGIPDLSNIKNEWDLSLGNQPLNLSIEAGAYQAEYQLGGLALTNLTVKDGASDVKMNFASPNLAEMSLLSYETGASNVSLTGLGNANFASLTLPQRSGKLHTRFHWRAQAEWQCEYRNGRKQYHPGHPLRHPRPTHRGWRPVERHVRLRLVQERQPVYPGRHWAAIDHCRSYRCRQPDAYPLNARLLSKNE